MPNTTTAARGRPKGSVMSAYPIRGVLQSRLSELEIGESHFVEVADTSHLKRIWFKIHTKRNRAKSMSHMQFESHIYTAVQSNAAFVPPKTLLCITRVADKSGERT